MSGWLGGFGGVFEKQQVTDAHNESKDMSQSGLVNFLVEQLPSAHAQFAEAYADAALKYAPLDLTPADFALLHAGLIDRESLAGAALKPRGPGGTGDHPSRWIREDLLPPWANELGLVTGNQRVDDATGVIRLEVAAPQWAGAEVAGWGYGLGQLDFAEDKVWLASNDWKDPHVNLDESAKFLSHACTALRTVRFGVAAYNAGIGRISKVKPDEDPDRFTTGKDYSADVIARAVGFGFSRQV